jgi:putative transposase
LFQRTETADLLLATIVRNRDKGEFFLHEFVIMPNHMHLLLTVDDDHAIGRAMQLIKGGFSHAIGPMEAESCVAAQLLRASRS